MAKAYASRHTPNGAEIVGFLRTFEGAAATFALEDGHWSLWLPELAADEHPLTPASQIFFPVILRHADRAFAIRFFYDCSTGKVRYYTSAIPEDIARLPEFENAISELFRHSLPVEAIRQRTLARKGRSAPAELPLKPRPASIESLAEPVEQVSPVRPRPAPVSGSLAPAAVVPSIVRVVPHGPEPSPSTQIATSPNGLPEASVRVSEPRTARPERKAVRHIRFEIGPRMRTVLLAIIFMLGLLMLGALGVYAYLQSTEDPGVLHHRLQLEELRARNGR